MTHPSFLRKMFNSLHQCFLRNLRHGTSPLSAKVVQQLVVKAIKVNIFK